jgi:FMN phosphatase YigB (HAD superfamily)
MTQCVIFDLGGVIVPIDLTRLYSQMATAGARGPDLPERVRSTHLFHDFEAGRLGPEEFARQVCRSVGIDMEYRRFCEVWSSIFLPEPFIPDALLESLARKHRLLLLSNTNVLHYEFIRERYPLLRHFHDSVLSYQIGCLKPEARIYEEAVARAGCRPEECFYTDDSSTYVEGARAVGIDAVQFQSLEQLLAEMRARGIAV